MKRTKNVSDHSVTSEMNTTDEPVDLVDEFYRPLVRPLGNLVITPNNIEA